MKAFKIMKFNDKYGEDTFVGYIFMRDGTSLEQAETYASSVFSLGLNVAAHPVRKEQIKFDAGMILTFPNRFKTSRDRTRIRRRRRY